MEVTTEKAGALAKVCCINFLKILIVILTLPGD